MIRLLIADDHTIVREGLKRMVELADDMTVVGEAVNGTEVLAAVERAGFDLLLLDMSMPGICGVELISRLRSQQAKLPILVLSMHNEPQIVKRALKSGANGYLTKDTDPERILVAIRKVAAGGRHVDPVVVEKIAFASSDDAHELRHDRLSDREFAVLRLLAKGLGANAIAARLAISSRTVNTDKAHLMAKIGVESGAGLVRYALANGLVD